MQRCFLVVALTLSFFWLVELAGGQVNPGLVNFSAFDAHEVDSVDLLNNNIYLHLPIMSKSGAMPFRFGLEANSYIYSNNGSWAAAMAQPGYPSGVGFVASANGEIGQWTLAVPNVVTHPFCDDQGSYATEYSNWYVHTADGAQHWLPLSAYTVTETGGSSCIHSFSGVTTVDGSGFTVSASGASSSSVRDSLGMSVASSGTTDSNGNSITTTTVGCGSYGTPCNWTDTLGLIAMTATQPSGGGMPIYKWSDVNGGTPTVTESTSNPTIRTNFGCSGINGVADINNSSSTPLPTSLSFPDGTSLDISYEVTPSYSTNVTGRIGVITLREGGTISYSYTGGDGNSNGLWCVFQSVPTLTRTLANGDTTTYTIAYLPISGSNYKATNTVIDPGGNQTVYTFTGFTDGGNASFPTAQVVTEVQHYQGTATLLTTDVYCYNTVFSSCSLTSAPTTTVTYPITSIVIMHQINGMANISATETHYDSYGNVTYTAQYDYGASSPTTATTTIYGTWNGSTCVGVGNFISSRPCDISTFQNGNTVTHSRFSYDSYGNLLTSYEWNGSSWLSNSMPNSYNPNGTISTLYDVANNPTNYSYNPTNYVSCASCTNYPLPTAITKGGLTTASTWNGIGGVKLSDTDASLNTTTYGYAACVGRAADPFWRVMSITDALGTTESCKTYPTGSAPDTFDTSFTFNSGNSIQNTITTTDTYGRTIRVQKQQGPLSSQYDTVSTSYGWFGNYQTVGTSQPCAKGLGGDCTIVHTVSLDPLQRTYQSTTTGNETVTNVPVQNDVLSTLGPAPTNENAKEAQNQYDGVGRLTSSCEVSSLVSGIVSCGQNANTSFTGVLTTNSYTSATGSRTVSLTRGSQTRSTTADGLGRITQKVTPEGGTWTYTYDSNTSCPSTYQGVAGKLASVGDPNKNLTCYAYDSSERVVGVNANGTTCRHFYFDNSTGYSGSIPAGVSTPTNSMGRLVEAATDACASGTLITDEWFSYDKDGNPTDLWQKSPHSTQYYHSVAAYAGNGAITSLQLASPNLYTMTYGLDGEGRWSTQKQGNTNIVTGPLTGMYDASGHALNVQLTGSTPDQDIYTYDPNTGRMKTFEFEVGSSNLTGTLSWNANGTLGQLQIADGFNSSGSEFCYSNSSSALGYGYDDLGRLVEFDCSSGNWGQQFSYDQYDNLTKAVIPGRSGSTWNPGYGSTNNRINGASYDSNGNITNDGGSNVYGWNEFSQVKWTAGSGTPTCGTNGKCITYDAFGRMVETSSGSAWVELWYTQIPGSRLSMNGTTENFAYWPSPGRGIFIDSGSKTFVHQDWLGNDRIVSSTANHTVTADRAYAPYGEQYNTFGSTNPIYGLFAGMSGDYDSGILFDTPNRELAPSQGRWVSPDPAGFGWNQYAYSTNPNSSVDPSGLCPMDPLTSPSSATSHAVPGCNKGAPETTTFVMLSNNMWYYWDGMGWSPLVSSVGADSGGSQDPLAALMRNLNAGPTALLRAIGLPAVLEYLAIAWEYVDNQGNLPYVVRATGTVTTGPYNSTYNYNYKVYNGDGAEMLDASVAEQVTQLFGYNINPPKPTTSPSGGLIDTVGIDTSPGSPLPTSSSNGVSASLQTFNITYDGEDYNNAGPVNLQIVTVTNGQVAVQVLPLSSPTACTTCKP